MLKKLIDLYYKIKNDKNYTKEECFLLEAVIEILEKIKECEEK